MRRRCLLVGLGFRIGGLGLGFRVWGSGFRVCGLGFGIIFFNDAAMQRVVALPPTQAADGPTLGYI